MSKRMIRKQIYLEPWQDRQVIETAARYGMSEAEVIRRAVSQPVGEHGRGRPDPVLEGVRFVDPLSDGFDLSAWLEAHG